jgi:hypothetical protein
MSDKKRKPKNISCRSCGNQHNFIKRVSVSNRYDSRTPLTIVTCSTCGLCFINPQYDEDAYSEYYRTSYYQGLLPDELLKQVLKPIMNP